MLEPAERVFVPVSQHIGAPAKPVVERGQKVVTGQVIAARDSYVSANIHATVSGTVGKIDKVPDISGFKRLAVQIDVEDDFWLEDIDRSESLVRICRLKADDIIKKVEDSGIVGLGGAAFPSHVKLNIPRGKKAGCHCRCTGYGTQYHNV